MVATGKNSEDVELEESRSVSASQSEKSDCVEDQVRVCGGDARDDRAGPSSSSEIADSNCIRGLNVEKEKPYHPNASSLPKQYLPGRALAFQDSWFSAFPWLHWDAEKDKLLCFYCSIFYDEKTSHLEKKIETSFTKCSFSNWKKGVQNFKIHQSSDLHANAVDAFLKGQDENTRIISHLNKNIEKNQTAARECLEIILNDQVSCSSRYSREG